LGGNLELGWLLEGVAEFLLAAACADRFYGESYSFLSRLWAAGARVVATNPKVPGPAPAPPLA